MNYAISAAALVFWRSKLEVRCTHSDTVGKPRKARVWKTFQNLRKTQYLMNTLYLDLQNILIADLFILFVLMYVLGSLRMVCIYLWVFWTHYFRLFFLFWPFSLEKNVKKNQF